MRNNRRTSIRKKILWSSMSALLLLAIVMGSVSVYVVGRLSQSNSEKIMAQVCEKETIRFDNKLKAVYHAVHNIDEYAKEMWQLRPELQLGSKEFDEQVEEFSVAIANQTEGALAVYYRYEPSFVGSGTQGFFWTKTSEREKFKETKVTNLYEYDENDTEHVGWFYIPKKKGKAMWMSPYYNKNLDVYMISYVIPLYTKKGEFFGVLGMDIDLKTILNEVHQLPVYQTGTAMLLDLNVKQRYTWTDNGGVAQDAISEEAYQKISSMNKFNEQIEMSSETGQPLVISFTRLCNDMLLCVQVQKKEITRDRDNLIWVCIIITLLVFVFLSFIILARTKTMIQPLEKLTQITRQYAQGDWTEQYISNTQDEVQRLSESISQMAQKTQQYITELNQLARTDAITGVGNKMSYLELVENIKGNEQNQFDRYAICVFDINLLKNTNDTYGHEAGDMLIKESANYICSKFIHSPVFRVGGDEFVAVLYTQDYDNRHELLEEFAGNMNYSLAGYPEVILSISYGMAECPTEHAEYDKLFELADERMYQKKKEMKMERGRTS